VVSGAGAGSFRTIPRIFGHHGFPIPREGMRVGGRSPSRWDALMAAWSRCAVGGSLPFLPKNTVRVLEISRKYGERVGGGMDSWIV